MIAGEPGARHGIFILLRRLRQPLMLLVIVYAISVLGFTLITGVDPAGYPWRMSFLHAFYFVSFLGTTIGLGEIPYPFSDVQRLWATASIYGTVLAWLYAIGALFSVLQDPMFRRIVREGALQREVRRLREPFYLLCGYDDTGHLVARELTEDSVGVVVIDIETERVDQVDIDGFEFTVPALAGDASDPRALQLAGLTHPLCAGVVALTGSDQVNTKIALTARMLSPQLPVLCAARDYAWHSRMAAAGADRIINPFDTFADRVALSIRTPSLHVIYEALTTQHGTAMDDPPSLPPGPWVLCGMDQFARSLRRELAELGIATTSVSPEPFEVSGGGRLVVGDPTDPGVLREAGVEHAAVLVAATAIDIDNLTITLAARAANKRLAIIARQTQRRNNSVFRASPADLVTQSGYVVAAEVLRHIRTPMLSQFLQRASDRPESWASELLQRLREVVGAEVLESWSVTISVADSPTVCAELKRGRSVTIARLMIRTDGTGDSVVAVPLLLQRGRRCELVPAADIALEAGDVLLFCGTDRARSIMRHTVVAHALAPAPVPGIATTDAA